MSTALEPCPDSPNCVSTQADPSDAKHYIAPLAIDASVDLVGIVESVLTASGAKVTNRSADRVDAIATTRLLRFKDDLSFVVDSDAGVLHARSASRVGHSDLGANRKRLTHLFAQIAQRLPN